MQLHVVLFPGQSFDAQSSVCIVVDTLRASSSIVTILDRGADTVVAAGTIDEARALSECFPTYLLCGERGSVPVEGFDYGNSPSEFSGLDLTGRSVILATSNGTRILAALAPNAPAVLVGALLNRTAVGRAALTIAARDELDITVICAGEQGGKAFALEDALGAGAIADAISAAEPAARLTDAARLARGAFRANKHGISGAVRSAAHSRELTEGGFGDDVAFCARVDVSVIVPTLTIDEDDVLRVRSGGSRD
jgi:2-phosphosulfolactate phosphatase